MDKILERGVSLDNIQQWDTAAEGLEASTKATTQAMDNFFSSRTAGAKSTNAFYAGASKVNLAVLEDISKKVSLYQVPPEVELKDQLIKAKLDWQFPFNTGEQKAHNYWKDCEDEVQHLNLKRSAWVRDQVEKIKEL